MIGLIGKKLGMSRLYDEKGKSIPVTYMEVGPCSVIQAKTTKKEGYDAVQLGYIEKKENSISKSLLMHFKKANVKPTKVIKEFRVSEPRELKTGQTLTVEIFGDTKEIDVIGISKGRGFAGTTKRHNFRRGRETHGSKSHREPGSIGNHSYPARVFPGQKLPGHYGHHRVTAKNLQLVGLDIKRNLLIVKGAVPGPNQSYVIVRAALQKKGKTK